VYIERVARCWKRGNVKMRERRRRRGGGGGGGGGRRKRRTGILLK